MSNQTIGFIAVSLFMIAGGVAGVDYGRVLKLLCQVMIWMLFQVSVITTAFAKSMFFAYIRFLREYKDGCADVKIFQQSVSQDLLEENEYVGETASLASTTLGAARTRVLPRAS
jgi:hypothetical protein